MTQKRATLLELLRQTSETEQSVVASWRLGQRMLSLGQAVPSQLATIDVLADRLFAIQQILTRPVFSAIDQLPTVVQAQIRRIPQVAAGGLNLVHLPSLSGRGSASTAAPVIRVAGLGDGGLASIPAGVLVAGVVLVVLLVSAVLMAITVNLEFFGGLVEDVQALRADAADARRRLETQQARYQDCLRAGGTPQSCTVDFPLPEPTDFFAQRQATQGGPDWWVIGLASLGGLVAIGGLLYVGVRAKNAGRSYRSLSEAL